MRITRRRLLGMLATGIVATSVPGVHLAGAQNESKVFRVGMLSNWGSGAVLEDLKNELAQLGYIEGKNIIFEARFPEGRLERLPGFASELVDLGVDVIATYGGPPTNAARKAGTTIPIVAAIVADPVAVGFAATLERPRRKHYRHHQQRPDAWGSAVGNIQAGASETLACRNPKRFGHPWRR
jgi:putative ABC transport system substrate-binding protein